MPKNKEILNEFENQIKQYKQLKLNEAQELYNKIIECEDNKLKKQLRNELITGTLYVIYETINSNELVYMNSSYYDMNDIINAIIEIWIKKIDSGEILKVDRFHKIFNYDFYNKISESFGIKNEIDIKEYLCDIKLFTGLIADYLNEKEKNENLDYYELIKYMREKPNYQQLLKTVDNNYYNLKKYENSDICINEYWKNWLKEHINESNTAFFELFDGIIKSFELDGKKLKCSKTTLYKIRNLIINNGLEYNRKNIEELTIKNLEDSLYEKELRQSLIEIIDECSGISDLQKQIVFKRFGLFDGTPKTLEEIGQEFGLTKEYVRQVEGAMLRKLRAPSRSKKIKAYLYSNKF